MEDEELILATLEPASYFEVDRDCETLRNAMKGLGTNDNALIVVLCRRSWQQRMEIARNYKQMFGKDLTKEIGSQTSGNFRKILERLLKTPMELAAFEAHKAIAGVGTDEEALVELICTNSEEDLEVLKSTYKQMYGQSFEQDVMGDTSGYFRRLLVALLNCRRPEDESHPDLKGALKDARLLFEAGERRLGDEQRFITILCNRSYRQLRAIFNTYSVEYKKDIAEVIKSEFSGDIAEGLLAIIGCIRNRAGYFAARLYRSMKGLGTNDNMLVRIVVSRCEFDLGAIKKEYARMYGKSLAADVADDTSGPYKRALLALIGD